MIGIANISYWEQNNGQIRISISNAVIAPGGKHEITLSNPNPQRPTPEQFAQHAKVLVERELSPRHEKLAEMIHNQIPRNERKPAMDELRSTVSRLESELTAFARQLK